MAEGIYPNCVELIHGTKFVSWENILESFMLLLIYCSHINLWGKDPSPKAIYDL